jgi:hypothetical protein
MTTATAPTTTTERAEELWSAAHQCLLDLQGVIVTIIAERAWEPLGYTTFADAWKDRMADITMAPEIRPYVVYQMFKEDRSPDQVAEMVKGVSPAVAAILQRQQQMGVPPDKASTRNAKPISESPYATLFIRLSRDTLTRWRVLAEQRGTTLEDFAFNATAAAFAEKLSA